MSSASPCSRKISIDGVKVDLDRYAVWQGSSTGSATRVRHRDDLVAGSSLLVTLKTRNLSAAAAAAALSDPALQPDAWRIHPTPAGESRTLQGGPGHLRDPRSALILGTLSTWKGGDTFHETDAQRAIRLRSLVQRATLSDPEWVRKLIPFVRSEGNMRTVAVHAAMDAAAIGHPDAAELIADTLQRADEPAVALQYWLDTYGKSIPSAVRRGIASAATRLYSEHAVMRYGNDGHSRTSAADVIRLCHPKPRDAVQSALFGALATRDKSTETALRGLLPVYSANRALKAVPVEQREALLMDEHLASRHAILTGDRSHRSVFAKAGFSTQELVAWMNEGLEEPTELTALRSRRRQASLDKRAAALRVKQTEDDLKQAMLVLRRELQSTEEGSALAAAKADIVASTARLREAKAARRLAAAAASKRPAWDRDPEDALLLSRARAEEQAAYEEYSRNRVDLRVAKSSFERKLRTSIPEHVVVANNTAHLDLAAAIDDYTAASERLRAAKPVRTPAEVWETMLPSMGYMELLRNVRNLESSGVDPHILNAAADRLADEDEIRASRQMPLRFWSAAKALAASPTFEEALERGVEITTESVPHLPGRTLVLVDQSGSMSQPYNGSRDNGSLAGSSSATLGEVAALYGAAIAKRSDQVDVVVFGSSNFALPDVTTDSVLSTVRTHGSASMGGTNTWGALRASFKDHDRVIILSDGQSSDSGKLPQGVPVHFFDLTGHSVTFAPENSPNYYSYGGLSDLSFRLFGLMEGSANAADDLLDQQRSADAD